MSIPFRALASKALAWLVPRVVAEAEQGAVQAVERQIPRSPPPPEIEIPRHETGEGWEG